MPYRVEYSPDAKNHLKALTARERAIVTDVVDQQLAYQPTVETRNRRPMRPNPFAPWELRVGVLRVYYDVMQEPDAVVFIRAVGIKVRHRVYIGKEAVRL